MRSGQRRLPPTRAPASGTPTPKVSVIPSLTRSKPKIERHRASATVPVPFILLNARQSHRIGTVARSAASVVFCGQAGRAASVGFMASKPLSPDDRIAAPTDDAEALEADKKLVANAEIP